ncbi:MAG: transmembrane Mn(2+) transporter, partial [Verrucomicrobiales bacterium]
VLCWLAMFPTGLAQLGGIVGGVGQALSISVPLTAAGRAYNEALGERVQFEALSAQLDLLRAKDRETGALEEEISELGERIAARGEVARGNDDRYWAVIIGVVTIFLLVRGGFGFIEAFCAFLVSGFTLVTVVNLFALQSYDAWAVTAHEFRQGLSFGFPELTQEERAAGFSPLATALFTFGIIGVGAAELVGYPYWCLEKGYGKWIGPREQSESWAIRARGWLRVLKVDAWVSMLIYTFSTIAFYLLGAAVLHRTGLLPEGPEMVRTLSVIYEPVFGRAAEVVFLVGAFAVLFSTFFVANAQKARLATDVADVFGFTVLTEATRRKGIRFFSVLFPALCVVIYLLWPRPVFWVLISGMAQSLLLPVLGFAALYFRYRKTDPRLLGGRLWDASLWLSFAGFLVVGGHIAWTKGGEIFEALTRRI